VTALLTSFIVRQRYGSISAIQRQCHFQIFAPIYRKPCCDLPTGIRYSELPIDKDYLHYPATIFRRNNSGSGTQFWNIANRFDSGHYLLCSSARLTTVDKLDRLTSHGPSATTDISTKPSQSNIIEGIVALLHYFQGPTDQQLRVRLTEITSVAVKLWSALRKDSYQVDFVYDPLIGDWQG